MITTSHTPLLRGTRSGALTAERVYKCTSRIHGANYCGRIMSDILAPAILSSQQLRFRVEQTVPCRNWNSAEAMGDYVMSRRCNGGLSKFCSLVSRLYDRESGTKKLNGYAMTWDVSSNIEYNVVHILKFQFESIYSRPGSRDSCISDQHRTFDCWPQPLEQRIMKRNIESSIRFPHLQVVEGAGLTAFFPH